jgi:hypothetical protein
LFDRQIESKGKRREEKKKQIERGTRQIMIEKIKKKVQKKEKETREYVGSLQKKIRKIMNRPH